MCEVDNKRVNYDAGDALEMGSCFSVLYSQSSFHTSVCLLCFLVCLPVRFTAVAVCLSVSHEIMIRQLNRLSIH